MRRLATAMLVASMASSWAGLVSTGSAVAAPPAAVTAAAASGHQARPEVTAVGPTSASTAGGAHVTVKGHHLSGAVKVMFGHTKGRHLSVKNDGKLSVVAPAHAAGRVDVRVVTRAGTSATTRHDRFRYRAGAPTVTAVAPASGGTAGGTQVTVTGTGFSGVTAVSFGSVRASATSVLSATSLRVTAPAQAAGLVDIRVSTAAGTSAATAVDHFTYVQPAPPPPPTPVAPTVTGVSPSSGSTDGGSTVTVSGTGFDGATGVTFGDTAGTSVTVGSSTTLTVTTPAHAQGVVAVQVSTASGTSAAASAAQFTYVAAPAGAGSVSTAPVPPGAASDPHVSMSGVDCPVTDRCVAVGTYLDSTNHQKALIDRQTSSGWVADVLPTPSDASSPYNLTVSAVSCASASSCVLVGNYSSSTSGVTVPLLAELTGTTWTVLPATAPNGITVSQLVSVSCVRATSPIACEAVGSAFSGSASSTLAYGVTGTTATAQNVPVPAGGAGQNTFARDVSCVTATSCAAAGQYDTSAGIAGLGATWNGSSWTATGIPLPAPAASSDSGGFTAISCIAAGCTAVGYYHGGAQQYGMAAHLASASWAAAYQVATPSNGSSPYLTDVSCWNANACEAAGYYTSTADSTSRPLTAILVNGSAPSTFPIATGGTSSASSVACLTSQRCTAAGLWWTGSAASSSTGLLVQNFTPGHSAAPSGATRVALTRVTSDDATSPTSMVAAGTFTDSAGNVQGLLVTDIDLPAASS